MRTEGVGKLHYFECTHDAMLTWPWATQNAAPISYIYMYNLWSSRLRKSARSARTKIFKKKIWHPAPRIASDIISPRAQHTKQQLRKNYEWLIASGPAMMRGKVCQIPRSRAYIGEKELCECVYKSGATRIIPVIHSWLCGGAHAAALLDYICSALCFLNSFCRWHNSIKSTHNAAPWIAHTTDAPGYYYASLCSSQCALRLFAWPRLLII
jgi:hypothetical protein